jgi:Holliday junction resolvasome RuvABC endonuclease subunit
MIALGWDPGVKSCGLALVRQDGQRWTRVNSVTVRTTVRADFVARLRTIADAARALIRGDINAPVACIGIEDPFHVFANKAGKDTNIHALGIIAVLGLACDIGFQYGIPVELVETGDVKRAVGAPANADKLQVQTCVSMMVFNCPKDKLLDEHQADAVATAIAAGRRVSVHSAISAARERRR